MEQLSKVMESGEEEIQAAIKGTGEMHRTTAAQREQEVGTTTAIYVLAVGIQLEHCPVHKAAAALI